MVGLLCQLFVLFLASGVWARPSAFDEHDAIRVNEVADVKNTGWTRAETPQGSDSNNAMDLCDCQPAFGDPGGLSCGRPGFFIVSFQHEGSWVLGGGLVPLSPVQCCRPCVPRSLAGVEGVPDDATAVAVTAVGCHAPSGATANGLICDADYDAASSAATGWEKANPVQGLRDTYYPIGPVTCCSAAVLLSSGDSIPIERCNCADYEDVSCPIHSSILVGYTDFRVNHLGEYVPIAPARCCQLCLGAAVVPAATCDALDGCSGHGVCSAVGSCDCYDGWGGYSCSDRIEWGPSLLSLPPWAVASLGLLVMVVIASVAVLAKRTLDELQTLINGRAEGGANGLREPLNPDRSRLSGDEGSVGSEDTEEEGSGTEGSESVSEVESEAAGAEAGQASPAAGAPAAAAAPGEASSGRRRRGRRTGAAANGNGNGAGSAAGAAAGPAHGSAENGGVSDGERSPRAAAAAAEREGEASSDHEVSAAEKAANSGAVEGVASSLCVVCFSRPIQAVLVPCGHASLCRRCARKVERCPLCRKEVLRRQRLYF